MHLRLHIKAMKTILQKIGMLIAVLCASISSYAYDIEIDGIYYNVDLSNMTASVTSGDKEYSGAVIIPSPIVYNNREFSVVSIENYAFYNCTNLKSIIMANTITMVGANSVLAIPPGPFTGCTGLEKVILSESTKLIGDRAFEDCTKLTDIVIPSSVTSIEYGAFYGCTNLTNVDLTGSSLEYIGQYAFCRCSSLTSVNIPNSVTQIESYAFYGCSSLSYVTIPNSVTTIEESAFDRCSSLTSVTIPNSVKEIGYAAFDRCNSLKTVNIEDSETSLTFDSEKRYDSYYYVSFKDSPLEEVYLGRKIIYPNEWEYDFSPFYRNSALKNISIGSNVSDVSIFYFSKYEDLATINCYSLIPPTTRSFTNKQYMDLSVFVPAEALEAYKADETWGNFWNLQASGVDGVKVDSKREVIGRYDLNGRAVSEDYQGFVIIRFSDGSTKKYLQQ